MRAASVVHEIGAPPRARRRRRWRSRGCCTRATTSCRFPGTKRRRYLEENVGGASLALDPAEIDALDRALPPEAVAGPRYNERMMAFIDR